MSALHGVGGSEGVGGFDAVKSNTAEKAPPSPTSSKSGSAEHLGLSPQKRGGVDSSPLRTGAKLSLGGGSKAVDPGASFVRPQDSTARPAVAQSETPKQTATPSPMQRPVMPSPMGGKTPTLPQSLSTPTRTPSFAAYQKPATGGGGAGTPMKPKSLTAATTPKQMIMAPPPGLRTVEPIGA